MRIAQLTTYPTRRPVHGGQIRAQRLGLALEGAGHEVIRLPFFCAGHHADRSEPPVIDMTAGISQRRHERIGEVIDLTLTELIATDDAYFAKFAEAMARARPDAVLLEEPWLWPALRRWRAAQASAPPVIFSAHNVESQAKTGILAETDHDESETIMAQIEALERDLARSSAAIVVTTARDAETFRAWTGAPIAVARNGTAVRRLAHLAGILPTPLTPAQKFLLFVGSAHPPNAAGFMSLVLPALARLRPGQRVVLAGGVCHLVAERLRGPNAMVRDRSEFLGPVSDLALDCLIANAAGILLPITYGGGSNLKTAEALGAGLPVIGTSIAFRGFEEYRTLPQVRIADTEAQFAAAVQEVLQAGAGARPEVSAAALRWEQTLAPAVALADAVAGDLARADKAGACS